MSDTLLTNVALNLIDLFLLLLGVTPPSRGGDDDTYEIKDYGPHRVYTQMARVPDELADSIDREDTLDKLSLFLNNYNTLATTAKFRPYDAEVYICPCCGDTFLYVGIYHTATT